MRNMITAFMMGLIMVGTPIVGKSQSDTGGLPTPPPYIMKSIEGHGNSKKKIGKKAKSKIVSRVLNKRFNFKHLIGTGMASFYGSEWNGSLTASGIPFNSYVKMCAMKYIPLHTIVIVKNLRTGLSTRCLVADRGPFVRGRIIDLSTAAAHAIGFNGLEAVAIYV